MSRCFQRLRVAQVKVNAAALHVECVFLVSLSTVKQRSRTMLPPCGATD